MTSTLFTPEICRALVDDVFCDACDAVMQGTLASDALGGIARRFTEIATVIENVADKLRAAMTAAIARFAQNIAFGCSPPNVRSLVVVLKENDDGNLSVAEIRAIYNNLAEQAREQRLIIAESPSKFIPWFTKTMALLPAVHKALLAFGVPLPCVRAVHEAFEKDALCELLADTMGHATCVFSAHPAFSQNLPRSAFSPVVAKALAEQLQLLSYTDRPDIKAAMLRSGIVLPPANAPERRAAKQWPRLRELEKSWQSLFEKNAHLMGMAAPIVNTFSGRGVRNDRAKYTRSYR